MPKPRTTPTDVPRHITTIVGVISIFIAVSVLFGWIFHVNFLIRISPDWAGMAVNTAICFLVSGGILLLLLHLEHPNNHWVRHWIRAGAVFVLVLAALNIIQYLYGINLGVDQLFLQTKDVNTVIMPRDAAPSGRMAFATAVNFMLIGAALLLATYKKPKIYSIAQGFALTSFFIPILILFGYIYEVRSSYGIVIYFRVAFHTSFLFILLGIGFLCAFPDKGIMRFLTGKNYYNAVLFRLSLTASLLMLLFGYTRILGQQLKLYDLEFGTAIIVTLSIFTLMILTFFAQKLFNKAEASRLKAEKASYESEMKVRMIIDNALEAFIAFNRSGIVVDWNKEATAIFGWTKTEILGKPFLDTFFPRACHQAYMQKIRSYLQIDKGAAINKHLELNVLRKDGQLFPIELVVSTLTFNNEIIYSAFIRDVSEHKKMLKKLENYAYYDPLTGIANRMSFNQLFAQELVRAQRMRWRTAIFFIDLDKFKIINDTFGHEAGDAVLQNVAGRLCTNTRKSDIVARFGGDEFVIVLVNIASSEAERIANNILKALKDPIVFAGHNLFISGSIGISFYPENAEDSDTLLNKADIALYRAKAQGDCYRLFEQR